MLKPARLRRTVRLHLAVCAASVLGLGAASALAAEVRWRAPEGCPDPAELRFRLERAIGMSLSDAAPLEFDVAASRGPRAYVAQVVIHAGAGEAERRRELDAPDCSSLADLVSVTIALALGSSGRAEDREPPPQRVGAAPPESREPTTNLAGLQEPAGSAALSRSEPWRPVLSGWVTADVGSLPAAGAGVAVAARLDRGRWGVRAVGTVLLEQQRALSAEQATSPGARLGLWTGALSGCVTPLGAHDAPLSMSACAGWELGRLWGEGVNVPEPRADGALWSAPRVDLGASLAFAVTGLRLGALLTLAVPLVRDDFVLRELGAVHRPGAVVGRAALGLEWAL